MTRRQDISDLEWLNCAKFRCIDKWYQLRSIQTIAVSVLGLNCLHPLGGEAGERPGIQTL